MTKPNILFIVWDACRKDIVKKEAQNLMSLAKTNLFFENAIAPARWTLPSHASMFTGQYPSEHGMFTIQSSFRSKSVLTKLSENDYSLYGVSANPFISQAYGFDKEFDEFHYTLNNRGFDEGININEILKKLPKSNGVNGTINKYMHIFSTAIRAEHPYKSIYNIARAGFNKICRRFTLLQSLSPVFDPTSLYSYSAERNTQSILDIIRRESETGKPFFIFANYMDSHHPYYPPVQIQREYLGEALKYREIHKINKQFAHPFAFIERMEEGSVSNELLQKIQKLYTGEIKMLDKHLNIILKELERLGMRKNTLIIITSDHGENLGEFDEQGKQRMGHVDSVSDHLLKVPLLIAHSDFDGETITDLVSLKNLAKVLSNPERINSRDIIDILRPKKGVAMADCPAINKDPFKRYPKIPEDYIQGATSIHKCVGFKDQWKVVKTSLNEIQVWKNGIETEIENAPDDLIKLCNSHLDALIKKDPSSKRDNKDGSVQNLEKEVKNRLKDLGYI